MRKTLQTALVVGSLAVAGCATSQTRKPEYVDPFVEEINKCPEYEETPEEKRRDIYDKAWSCMKITFEWGVRGASCAQYWIF